MLVIEHRSFYVQGCETAIKTARLRWVPFRSDLFQNLLPNPVSPVLTGIPDPLAVTARRHDVSSPHFQST